MPKITLNPLVTDIRNRMGTVVFSKWKGVNYVKEFTPVPDANTDAQKLVRGAFSSLVRSWKNLDSAIKESWNNYTKGKNMTGYNAFISRNFQSMKDDLELMVSMPMGEEPLRELTAAAGSSPGEIDCTCVPAVPAGKTVIFFTRKNPSAGKNGVLVRHKTEASSPTITLDGLEPDSDYHVYAVVTDSQPGAAARVSASVSATARSAG